MKKWHAMLLLAICLALTGVCFAAPASAENESPIAISVELDPELELSGTGTITYIRFTLANASDAPYLLHNASLSCEKLDVQKTLDETIEVPARSTKEIMLQNVPIDEAQLDTALTFQFSWQEVSYAPEDLENVAPLYSDRTDSVEITVPRFVEPVISVSVSSSIALAKPGATVTATYTLKNDTKFDMTSLSLYDVGSLNMLIPLEKSSLLAGETMQVTHTFEMGDAAAQLQPRVLYNVRGKLVETTAETPALVESAVVRLDFAVQTYPATAEGTLFSITVTNSGSHAMTDITIYDEIQTEVAKPFNLAPEQTKTLSYLVVTAVSATQSRMVTFTVSATDCLYETYTFADPNTYEVLPYITSEQVNISLYATLTNTYTNENGVLCGTVAFELRNYSAVALKNASLRETLVYTATPLITYPELTYGITTFSQEFAVADLSALSFVLSALDPAGNEYHSQAVTIDLSSLSADPGVPAEDLLVSPDVIGNGIDMEKYFKLAYKALLIIAICVGVCCVIIYGLYSAEKRERANLPLEDNGLSGETFDIATTDGDEPDSFRTGRMEPLSVSEQAAQYGYVAPTKLRYIEQADRPSFSDIPAANAGEEAPPDVKVFRRNGGRVTSPTIVVSKQPVRGSEALGETHRFDALKQPLPRNQANAPTAAADKVAPVQKASRYPKGVPTALQSNRRMLSPANTVFRVEN